MRKPKISLLLSSFLLFALASCEVNIPELPTTTETSETTTKKETTTKDNTTTSTGETTTKETTTTSQKEETSSTTEGSTTTTTEKHVHTFEDYSHNEKYHWQDCILGDGERRNLSAHSFAEAVVIKEATEEETGISSKECMICGYVSNTVIPKLTHTHRYGTPVILQEPTENEAGLQVKTCELCGQQEREFIPTIAHTHTFTEYIIVVEPTELKNGLKERSCLSCGTKEQILLDKLPHTHRFKDYKVLTDPTEDEEGVMQQRCACGETQEAPIDKLAHTHKYTIETVITPATETETGVLEKACSCGEKIEVTIPVLSHTHNYGEFEVVTPATEDAPGLKRKTCSCGDVIEEPIPKLDHTHQYSDWKVISPATETSYGVREQVCATCGDVQRELIEKLPHTHNWGEYYVVTAATEEAEGIKERECTICEEKEQASIDKLPHTHKFNTYAYEGDIHWGICACGETSDEENHTYTSEVVISPTRTTKGLEKYTCETCEYYYTIDLDTIPLNINASNSLEDFEISEENRVITIYCSLGYQYEELLSGIISSFEAIYEGWTVELIQSNDLSNTPDLAFCDTQELISYVESGALVDLYPYMYATGDLDGISIGMDSFTLCDFDESYLNNCLASNYYSCSTKYSSSSYVALPITRTGEVLYYNEELLYEADVSVPTTWDELWEACATLKANNPSCTPVLFDNDVSLILNHMIQNDWSYMSLDAEYTFYYYGFANWLSQMKKYYEKGYFDTRGNTGIPSAERYSSGESIAFVIGSASDCDSYYSDYSLPGITTIPGTMIDGDILYSTIQSGVSIAMFKQDISLSEERELMTWELLKLIESYDFITQAAIKTYTIPALSSSLEDWEYQELFYWDSLASIALDALLTISSEMQTLPHASNENEAFEELKNILLDVIQGTEKPYYRIEQGCAALNNTAFELWEEIILEEILELVANTMEYGNGSYKLSDFNMPYIFEQYLEIDSKFYSYDMGCFYEYDPYEDTFIPSEDETAQEGKEYYILTTDYVTLSGDILYAENDCLTIEDDIAYINPVEPYNEVVISFKLECGVVETQEIIHWTIYREPTPEEVIELFYNQSERESEVIGYVVGKFGTYQNNESGYLFIQAQDNLGGYFAYRVYCTKDQWDSIEIGTRIRISSAKVKMNENGLHEIDDGDYSVNYFSIVGDEYLPEKTEAELLPSAIDDLVAIHSPKLIYHTGDYVSLTSWMVKKVVQTSGSKEENVLVLEKAGAEISIRLSNITMSLGKTDAISFAEKVRSFSVGDYVDVTGYLYHYDEWCILPKNINSITSTTFDDNASLGEVYELIEKVNAFAPPVFVNEYKMFTVDNYGTGIEIIIDVYTEDESFIVDKKINMLEFMPTDEYKVFYYSVTAKKGDYVYSKNFEFAMQSQSEENMVEYEKDMLSLDYSIPGTYTISLQGSLYPCVSFYYEIMTGDAVLDGNQLSILSVDELSVVTVHVTFTCGEAVDDLSYDLYIDNPSVAIYTEATSIVEGMYLLAVYQENLDITYYFDGVDMYQCLGATDLRNAAQEVYISSASEDTYIIYYYDAWSGEIKFIGLDANSSEVYVAVMDSPFEWTFDTTYSTFTATVNENTYFLGMYDTSSNITASKISYIETSFPCKMIYMEYKQFTRQEKIDYVKDTITLSSARAMSSYELPKSDFEDVIIEYSLVTSNSLVRISDNIITFDNFSDEMTVKVLATITCGTIEDTKTLSVLVTPLQFLSVTEAVKDKSNGDEIYITGYVTKVSDGSYFLMTDGITEFKVYGALSEDTYYGYNQVYGKMVSVYGNYQYYQKDKMHETYPGAIVYSCTDPTDKEKANLTLSEISFQERIEANGTITLTSQGKTFKSESYEIIWSVKSGSCVSITDNELTVTIPEEGENVTIEVSVNFNGTLRKKQFIVYVASYEEIAESVLSTVQGMMPSKTVSEKTTIDFSKLNSTVTIVLSVPSDAETVSYNEETKKLTITPGMDETTEEISFYVTAGEYTTETKAVNIVSIKGNDYVVTASMITKTSSYITTSAEYTVDDITYEVGNSVGNYGSVLQFKKGGTAYLKNNTAFSKDIRSITLFFGSQNGGGSTGGTAYPKNVSIEVAKSSDFSDSIVLEGVSDGSYVTYSVEDTGYVYYRIINTSTQYAVYLNSVKATLGA